MIVVDNERGLDDRDLAERFARQLGDEDARARDRRIAAVVSSIFVTASARRLRGTR